MNPVRGPGLASAVETVLETARTESAFRPEYPLHHLRNRVSVRNYARIAEESAATLGTGARILDWGAGHGQNNFLLRSAGLDVTSFDVQDWGPGYSIKEALGVRPVIGTERTALPFPDASFDGVLSCGCLEHVEDPAGSVREVHRVLKPGGSFLVYFLPNRWSYTEAIASWRGRSDHPVKYTPGSLDRLMAAAPFSRAWWRYHNLLPKNLTGLPEGVRRFYDARPGLVAGIEGALLRLPGLRLVSGTIEARYVKA